MIPVFIYVAAIAAANLSAATFGPAVTPVNAFLLIGLDLSLRDHLHDKWRGPQLIPRMLTLIGAAGAVSYAVNPAAGQIAVASLAAFLLASIVDATVYQALIARGYLVRSNGSNAAGAAVDSVVFPAIAFGGFLPGIVALQFAAKVVGGVLWAWAIKRLAK